ncbi:MAG: hypothetical protein ACYTG1_01865 [Planctomycetota bacterium]|jgi:hypothetical protein
MLRRFRPSPARRGPRRRGTGLLLAALLGGCGAYDGRYVFEPRPLDVTTAVPGEADAAPLPALVTVIGVRRADRRADRGPRVELRLRLENPTATTIVFDPVTLRLIAADLTEFPPAIAHPPDAISIEPGAVAVVDASFPFPDERPPGGVDLSGLSVRWEVTVGGRVVTCTGTFTLRPPVSQHHYHHYGPGRFGWRGCW